MVEALQMFLFLFKSKYRRKWSWFSPFLCSVLIVLLFCQESLCKCSEVNCLNGVCNNETCVCLEGWQGPECQYCGGKIKLTAPTGIISDGPSNYSVSVQCTWLIAPEWTGPSAPSIRIRLESFATECGWDYLYIYDGNSVRAATLLAVYSGVFQPGESTWTRQVIAKSGQALLHFFSDDAYAMEGFNVTYAAYSCPSDSHHTNCSDHGVCEDGECRCSQGWVGVACDEPLCPNDCNAAYSAGTCTPTGCQCLPPRAGVDCSRDWAGAGWGWAWRERGETPPPPRAAPPPVAGHVLLAVGGALVTVGGESFGAREFLYKYKISEGRWEPIEGRGDAPAPRYLHSAIMYGHEAIVYGGVILSGDKERGGGLVGLEGRAGEATNELWRIKLDASRPEWVNATPTTCSGHRPPPLGHCGGLEVSGHTAVLVYLGVTRKPVMLTFFGHSPHYGYLHLVQEYYIEEGHWSVAATRGWAARGGFGHAAAWDPLSRRVYVVGGLLSQSEAAQAPSAELHEYDVESRVWRPLPSAPTPRYLHSATFISPGIMLVFGGNAHNDSAAAAVSTSGSKCYSGSAELYDVRCAAWRPAPAPPSAARVAHAAALHPSRAAARSVIIHGGFDGRLRSDALIFSAGGQCGMHASEYSCLRAAASAARACVWRDGACVPLEEIGWKESFEGGIKACLNEPILDERRCLSGADCESCAAAGCAWCGACYASAAYCPRHRHQMALSIEECGGNGGGGGEACGRFHSCAACHAHRATHAHSNEDAGPRVCYWDYESVKCRPANLTEDLRSAGASGPCAAPCATYRTCGNCTAEECIWCASAGRCVDKNAYGASFPLGGCRAWSTGAALCGAGCSQHASCRACRAEPACGWCDDGARAGRGSCLPGGAGRPHDQLCPADRWHFTACPACQCNGHATCDASSACVQPCGGRAVGPHCELCAPGHWGSSLNGAQCAPCDCVGAAASCAADSGRCHCSTKGLAGERCDKCDAANHYHPDPYNKGICYYDLAVDYQFTFNLSKKEDRHLTAINFRNSPLKADVDADFSITCSAPARMNLTVRTRGPRNERPLFTDVNCSNFRYKFAKSDHTFGMEHNESQTTFFVYVYEFKPPLWIQISFSQYPKLNLQQFFITFSSCFLLLLLAAAAMWKIKQKYDMYRRRQRLFVEMEQMASRPFSQVSVELERGGGGGGPPAPVALEPCRGARAAVLSLLVRLPTGGTGVAPPLGGLAVASALVTLGLQPPAPAQRHARHAPRPVSAKNRVLH